MLFKGFSIFSFGCHFVQQSRAILAILAEGNPRNIPVKQLCNQSIGPGEDVIIKSYSNFSSDSHLFNRAESF